MAGVVSQPSAMGQSVTLLTFSELMYRYMSLISAIYAMSEEHTQDGLEKTFWHDLSDRLISDLGSVHSLWKAAGMRSTVHMEALVKPQLALTRTAQRIEKVIAHLTLWTGQQQRLNVSYLAERYLGRMIETLAVNAPALEVGPVTGGCASRIDRLAGRIR